MLTAADKGFVQQYYKNSTFSFLSEFRERAKQWCADILAGVLVLRIPETSEGSLRASPLVSVSPADVAEFSPSAGDWSDPASYFHGVHNDDGLQRFAMRPRAILHVDLDSFYASVAERDEPALRGHPLVIVPGSAASPKSSSSEVCTANYIARQYGIKPRMLLRDAWHACPSLQVRTAQFDKYEEVSKQLYTIFLKYTRRIEAVSADEALLDVSQYADALQAARALHSDVQRIVGLPCSIGVGNSPLVARLALSSSKPNGIFQPPRGKAELVAWLQRHQVASFPGVGPATAQKLRNAGVHTARDLAALQLCTLRDLLGPSTAERLHGYARGKDARELRSGAGERQSIGTQISWGVRVSSAAEMQSFVRDVATEVSERLRRAKYRGKSLTLTIKRKETGEKAQESSKFLNPGAVRLVTAKSNFASLTQDAAVIYKHAITCFGGMHIPLEEVRGLALQVRDLQALPSNPLLRMAACEEKSCDNPITKAMQRQRKCSVETLSTNAESQKPGRPRYAVMTMQHVDPEVFAALPAALQAELREEFEAAAEAAQKKAETMQDGDEKKWDGPWREPASKETRRRLPPPPSQRAREQQRRQKKACTLAGQARISQFFGKK